MDKKNIIIGVLVISVVVCGYFVLQNRSDSIPPENKPALETNANPPVKTAEPENNISINELITAGKPVMCTASLTEGPIGSGQDLTIFVANSRVRSVSNIKTADKNFSPNIIITGGYQYIWPVPDSADRGEKINIAAIAKEAPAVAEFMKGFGMDEKIDYDCSPWTIDEQKFSLPEGIVFEDVTEKTRESLKAMISGENAVSVPVPQK